FTDPAAPRHCTLSLHDALPICYPESNRDLTIVPWREERMTVAAYPSHAFAGRELVSPEELNGQPFIAFDEEVIIRRELDRFFRRSEEHTSELQSLRQLVCRLLL